MWVAVAAVFVTTHATQGCEEQAPSRVEVALHNHGMATIERRALAASDPTSPLYGQFFSFDEVVAVVHRPASLAAVLEAITKHRLLYPHAVVSDVTVSADRQWVRFSSGSMCLPTALKKLSAHVAMVVVHPPTDQVTRPSAETEYYLSAHRERQTTRVRDPPSSWPPGPPITKFLPLHAVETYYNVTDSPPTGGAASNASASVFEVNALLFNGEIVESYNPPDLATFQALSDLPDSPVTHFAGDNVTIGCPEYTCAEPVLDVSMLRGIAPTVNFTYWSTNIPNSGDTDTVLTWLVRLSEARSPSWVNSISWGPAESGMSADVALRMDQEFAKLTSRGLSFIASSGDDGVNNRAARGNPSKCGLSPQYPASSPWVTAVGGTIGPQIDIPERTCQTDFASAPITSGGGFSTLWEQPSYQTDAVQGYFNRIAKGTLPPSSVFNTSNRGYPDVALLSWNIDTIVNQNLYPGSGTSASAPLFAGMLARILPARLAKGLPPFGLVNVHLYQLAGTSVFRDITVGANHCTGVYGTDQNYTCCPQGFNATSGWDPVTGLGSVDYGLLKLNLLNPGK